MEHATTRVLLVEDNPGDARLVREMLSDPPDGDFVLTVVTTVRDALDHLADETNHVDAVLLDLSLPDESGLATVKRVVEASARTVIVVMTGAGDEELGRLAMQEGAQDYLVKGQVGGRMLRRAVRFAIERQDLRLQLQSLTLTDDLTGLHNRRGFLLLAEQHVKAARQSQTPFFLFFFDLDRLKRVNDTFGHAEGDRVILEAAELLRGCFRGSDVLGRLGGDEFAALGLASAGSDETVVRARLDSALARANAKSGRVSSLGFSLGVLNCPPRESASVESLLERVDALMYLDKRRKGQAHAQSR
jgi:diguanylate cyclase (GGDEF)-like protein